MENVDLEKFPTSETAKRMMKRISPIYGDSYVGKWLFQVMGIELDDAWTIINSIKQQCFLEQCTWGIRYWEERYGITPDETKDLEVRRQIVINKRRKYGPISPAALEDILESVINTTVSITEDNSHYSFIVSIITDDTESIDFKALIEKLDSSKPSHLSYRLLLPKTGTITFYCASTVKEVQRIINTTYNESGLNSLNYLVNEDEDSLMNENGYFLTI